MDVVTLVVCISRKKRLISLETGRHTEFGWKEKKDPCSAFLGGFVFKIESKSPSCSWRGQLLKFSHPQRRLLVFFLLCLWSSLVGFSELPWHTRKTAAAVRPSPKHQQTWLKRWGHESGGGCFSRFTYSLDGLKNNPSRYFVIIHSCVCPSHTHKSCLSSVSTTLQHPMWLAVSRTDSCWKGLLSEKAGVDQLYHTTTTVVEEWQ